MKKKIIAILLVYLLLLALFFCSVNMGSIQVGFFQLWKGIFLAYDPEVITVFDLRFPRILIAILAGGGLALSGVLLQAVLKNPLADPGIIGVSSGAQLVTVLIAAFFPILQGQVTLFSFLGGMAAFFLVYVLSLKNGYSYLRIILIGIAVEAVLTGLAKAVNSFSGGNVSAVTAVVEGTITMKTWEDVRTMTLFVVPGLVLALFCMHWCDLLGLEDKTVRGLGLNVKKIQLLISLVAVLLASSCTAIVGVVGFLGLLVPHIGRLFVGHEHKYLMPFSVGFGALLYLLADTVGRTIAYPYEISASILMNIIGGPIFIILLQRSRIQHG